MQRYFAHLEELADLGEVLSYSGQVCREMGVVRQSYHLTPQFDAPNSMRVTVYAHGFSEEWMERYKQPEFRLSDPIPSRVMRAGRLMTWREAMRAGPNTPANEAYFAAMREEGLIHGFGVPLYGPRGRDAYAAFDFGIPLEEVSDPRLGVVRSVPQAAHQRMCTLIDSHNQQPELSEREREVLQWITRGKSVASIAQILSLSNDTVKTYSKRVYAKLDVSDRVGATVAALKLGLVEV
jgi:DNA-binding CsgD family transcriptional regulator